MLEGVPDEAVRLCTIVPHTWRCRGDQLGNVDPKRLLSQFRTQLNRAGLAKLEGWLIASVHGDYDPTSDTFQPHLHVLVVGEKAEAVESLQNQKLYRRDAAEHVRQPIIPRKLKNPARQISYYLAQPFWPSRATLTINGRKTRERGRKRIPEPRHAEFLMWLDRQTFADLVWLHGCSLRNGRLVVTARPS